MQIHTFVWGANSWKTFPGILPKAWHFSSRFLHLHPSAHLLRARFGNAASLHRVDEHPEVLPALLLIPAFSRL